MTMTKEYVISLFLFNLWSNILINFLTVSCKIMLSITTENALIGNKKKKGKKMYDGKHRPFGKFLIVKKLSFL